jgi:hypothetical protein
VDVTFNFCFKAVVLPDPSDLQSFINRYVYTQSFLAWIRIEIIEFYFSWLALHIRVKVDILLKLKVILIGHKVASITQSSQNENDKPTLAET